MIVPAAAQTAVQKKEKTSKPAASPAIKLSPVIPSEVAAGWTGPDAQLPFDVFSWNSFIAVNWPPAADGQGDPTKKIGTHGDNATVWERWIDTQDIFLPDGQAPQWDKRSNVPEACKKLYHRGETILQQVGKTPDLLTASVQPFDTGPLIDQNGVYGRFQVNVNRSSFDYILSNALYSKAGQEKFSGPVNFPCGQGRQTGAMTVKAAWKILGRNDDPRRYHKAEVLIYTPAVPNTPIQESCTKATVGMVGFHIGHKVANAPQWVWSTFEQVDNAPTQEEVSSHKLKSHYAYYNPQCKDCEVNVPAPRPWVPNKPGQPTQIVRVKILSPEAAESADKRNHEAQRLLRDVNAGSVWQYYELVSTQWPATKGVCTAVAPDFGNPAPQFLANTTLETFIQGTTPNTSSSCIACHRRATLATGGAPGSGSDFVFLLQSAK